MMARAWSAVIAGWASVCVVGSAAGSALAVPEPSPTIRPVTNAPLATAPVTARRQPVFLLVCDVIDPPCGALPDPVRRSAASRSLTVRRHRGTASLAACGAQQLGAHRRVRPHVGARRPATI